MVKFIVGNFRYVFGLLYMFLWNINYNNCNNIWLLNVKCW